MMVMMEMRMMMMLLTNTMADRDDKMVIMKPKYKLCQNLQQQKLSDQKCFFLMQFVSSVSNLDLHPAGFFFGR